MAYIIDKLDYYQQQTQLLRLMLAIAIILIIWPVVGSSQPTPEQIEQITQNWVCKWCPYPGKVEASGEIQAGAGYISNDSYKQGDYRGLDEKGVYPIADLKYDQRSAGENSLAITGSELGTDARNLSVEGRSRGSLSGQFSYSEIPKLNSDTARTPYRGSSHQQLPAGWTTGATTQAMPQLASSLRDVDIYTNRKRFSLAASYQQDENISYELGFRRDTKEGRRTAGLAIGSSFVLARSAILAIPVDFVTDQGEVKVNYVQRDWHASLSYQFSRFENDNNSIRWDNAFSFAPSPEVPEGQAALEPDNSAHKIIFTGFYRLAPVSQVNLYVGIGQMKQDDTYLPYTVNGALTPFALPVSSLDGKINTFDTSLKFLTEITSQLTLEAGYLQNEQDNDTSRYSYDYIIADTTQSGTPRANFPYSFRKIQYLVSGRYVLEKHEVSLGVDRLEFDRTYQEVETTAENTLRGQYRNTMQDDVDLYIRLSRSERSGDKYQAVAEITPPENPLLRKYNLADLERDQMGLSVNYTPEPGWQLAAYFDAYKDLYSKSDIGLLESIQRDYTLAVQHQVSKRLAFDIDYSITRIESTQAGSQGYSVADWYAVNDDQIDVLHLGVSYLVIPNILTLAMEYSYAESEGKIRVSTGSPLPKLASKRHTLVLQADYTLDKNSVISGFYRYEDYDESDWATDGVNPDTLENVLSLGEVSPSYSIGILGVALRYRF